MNRGASELKGDWNYPTSVRFGAGRIAELPEACASLGIERPLLITDAGLARLAIVKDALGLCEAAGLPTGLFSEVEPNPTGGSVAAGVTAYREGGHDGVIAFGGGSGLDAGKAVALMVGQNRPLWDFEDKAENWKRVKTEGVAPVVAVPTTAGTGSETGRASVLTSEETQSKKIIFHPVMMPRLVIADPALTVGLPPHLTAATGFDALSHSFEAFCASGFHPMADGISVEGMRLIKQWLPVAFGEGANLEARAHMMAAASMGSTAFQKGLGAIHALSHPVNAVYDTHHGLTNAVFMPYVMAFNRPAIEARMELLARCLDLPDPSFRAVLDWVLGLRETLGIPHTARDLGVEESLIPALAEMAAREPPALGNPRKAGPAEMRRMYQAAYEGRLD
ncbi:MAG: iron-containing alcohol dehydrogenase [Alphaproteobacteria bacterium]